MKCRICGNEDEHDHFTVNEMMYGSREQFKYYQCDNCGCLQITDIPSDMSKYYPDNYYSYSNDIKSNLKTTNAIKDYLINERDKYNAFGSGFMGKIISLLYPTSKYNGVGKLKLKPSSRILDVGCGSGEFLEELFRIGYKDVCGIDPFNNEDLTTPSGVDVYKKSIFDVSEKYDLIMYNHSFEHIPEQYATLEQTSKLLSPGGCCMLRIPIVSSYAWDNYKTDWVQLDAPRHLFLHSVESIKLLATRVGMSIIDIEYDSTDFQFWGSEQYKKGIHLMHENSYAVNSSPDILSQDVIQNYKRKAEELNKTQYGDQAIFYIVNSNSE